MWSALAIAIANNHKREAIRNNQVVSEPTHEEEKDDYEVFCCFIRKKKEIKK